MNVSVWHQCAAFVVYTHKNISKKIHIFTLCCFVRSVCKMLGRGEKNPGNWHFYTKNNKNSKLKDYVLVEKSNKKH